MDKILLMILLAVVSRDAMAEWIEIGSDDEHTITIYADPASINKLTVTVKIWSLNDFKTKRKMGSSGESYMSAKTQFEINCKGAEARNLAIQLFSNGMGKGHLVTQEYIIGNWKPIAPESGAAILMKYACGMTDWKRIYSNTEMTIFVNPTLINKRGNALKFWSLLDFNASQVRDNLNYLSIKQQNEFDCKENQFRTVAFWWYSENMGDGEEVLSNYEQDKWNAVIPGSAGEALLKIACDKE